MLGRIAKKLLAAALSSLAMGMLLAGFVGVFEQPPVRIVFDPGVAAFFAAVTAPAFFLVAVPLSYWIDGWNAASRPDFRHRLVEAAAYAAAGFLLGPLVIAAFVVIDPNFDLPTAFGEALEFGVIGLCGGLIYPFLQRALFRRRAAAGPLNLVVLAFL